MAQWQRYLDHTAPPPCCWLSFFLTDCTNIVYAVKGIIVNLVHSATAFKNGDIRVVAVGKGHRDKMWSEHLGLLRLPQLLHSSIHVTPGGNESLEVGFRIQKAHCPQLLQLYPEVSFGLQLLGIGCSQGLQHLEEEGRVEAQPQRALCCGNLRGWGLGGILRHNGALSRLSTSCTSQPC